STTLSMTRNSSPASKPNRRGNNRSVTTYESLACHLSGVRMPPAVLHRQDWQKAAPEKDDCGARAVISNLPASALLALSPIEAKDIDTKGDLQST
ncbi:hypothetical protein, partial [Paracoccus sp. AS002]|uniref:hypothetical protein n=1 Tax=Paracoccus sp. AS002 TaxID=3019545 RepID=UPI0023E759F1